MAKISTRRIPSEGFTPFTLTVKVETMEEAGSLLCRLFPEDVPDEAYQRLIGRGEILNDSCPKSALDECNIDVGLFAAVRGAVEGTFTNG